MRLHQIQQLANLIELGLASFRLDVHPQPQRGVPVDPVASRLAIKLKPERRQQPLKIAESNVATAGNDVPP